MSTTQTTGTETKEFNALRLHALLLDTITFLKCGQHLAPNWKAAKNDYCNACGYQTNITAKSLLKAIGYTYADNKMADKFTGLLIRFKALSYLD